MEWKGGGSCTVAAVQAGAAEGACSGVPVERLQCKNDDLLIERRGKTNPCPI